MVWRLGGDLGILEMENFRLSFWLMSLSLVSFFRSSLLASAVFIRQLSVMLYVILSFRLRGIDP